MGLMKRVVLTASGERETWMRKSILSRADIRLAVSPDLRASLQSIYKEPPNLFVVCDEFDGSLVYSLKELHGRYPQAPFPALVLTPSEAPPAFPPPVKMVLPIEPPVETFNEAVAKLLELPSRHSVRFPVRIGVNLGNTATCQIGSTVNVSASGMLVEALKPLTVGNSYAIRFIGPARVAAAEFSARVLRQENLRHPGIKIASYVLEWEGISENAMESFLKMLLKETAGITE